MLISASIEKMVERGNNFRGVLKEHCSVKNSESSQGIFLGIFSSFPEQPLTRTSNNGYFEFVKLRYQISVSQPVFAYSKSTMETTKQCVKYVQSQQ